MNSPGGLRTFASGFGLRDALRMVRRSPGLSLTAIATLAVGIAAPTTMFSLASGILGDLPFDEPDELVEVEKNDLRRGLTGIEVTPFDLDAWRTAQTSFEGLAAVDRRTFQVSGSGPRPVRRPGAAISPEGFALLGEPPVLGRHLTPEDARPAAPPVVLLGERLWEEWYGRDPSAIGGEVRVEGVTRTVVGVMPEGFEFPRRELLWIPLVEAPGDATAGFSVFGRLRDGVGLEAAQTEFDVIARNMATAYPDTHRDVTVSIHTFGHAELGDGEAAVMLYVMTLVLSFILVVACVNVAHLLLVRAAGRSREIAMRMALGAGRRRVLASLLAESLVLSVAGGALGVALTYGGVAWLDARIGPVINLFWAVIEVDGAVLAFVAVLIVLSAVLAGILPARQASRVDLSEAMKETGRTSTSFRAGRATRALVGAQIAFSCGLLILSGLMVKGVVGLAARSPAFEPDGVLTARLELREFDYPGAADRLAFVEELRTALAGSPGVTDVVFASGLPGVGTATRRIEVEPVGDVPTTTVGWMAVSPEFFAAFRREPVEGRLFSEQPLFSGQEDRMGAARVAVVNDVFAERFAPDRDLVGARLRYEDDAGSDNWIEIIGVVRDGGVFSPGRDPQPGVLVPLTQAAPQGLTVSVRSTGDPGAIAALVRDAVSTLNPDLPVYDVAALRGAIRDTSVVQRTFGTLFGVFGLIALLMAVVGLYGVVAFGAKRRTRELGIHRTLGAPRSRVVWLTLRGVVVPLAVGMATGVGLAFLLAPALGQALFGVSPRDPAIYAAVGSVLGAATVTAALVPSIAAARIEPMEALRTG